MLLKFPTNFIWGTATSSYQVEGATKEDGRGPSIWDTFCQRYGKIKNGDTGDVACDHYHRYNQDLDMMKQLGLQTYRFSVAWPRILPTGSGQVNQKGLDFYKRLVEGLHQRGIRPMATLYHWDLPQALQTDGGWTNRDTAKRFAEYSQVVFQALGDQVESWITHNEPWVVAYVGNAFGSHAPGLTDWATAVQVTHTLLLSHGLAVQAFRALNLKNTQIGITLNLTQAYPVTDSAEDKAAAGRIDGFQNRWFLDPVFKGAYPADTLAYFDKKYGPLDYIKDGDSKIIASPVDFLGINYYSPSYVANNPLSGYFETDGKSGHHPVTEMGWEIVPQGLYDLLVRLKKDYGDIPLYITENGAAFKDSLDSKNQVNDGQRLQYLYQHIAAAQRAITDGVNLKGYFAWSLMDNFEWAEGYTKRFGLVYVDYKTQQRFPKRSALWYQSVIQQNGLGAMPSDLAQI
jgi:beta-glucosidase